MSLRTSSRSAAAAVVGWVIVVIVGWMVLRFVLGTIFWMLRGAILIAVVVGLVLLWLTLKAPDDD
ncbi:MAG: hypothetical protein R2713_22475 [Ilumatobacteraceae bacterium]|nr:hypothetical protein [Acidimicrobiales bacterium]MCB9395382.1 hypothetical protein [Acidimicrobiaceae bacterium]